MQRIVIRDEHGNVIGLEFVEKAADVARREKAHTDRGRKVKTTKGKIADGLTFIEG